MPTPRWAHPSPTGRDLVGDGSLVLLPAPGRTTGSLSLLVRQPGHVPLLMVGDLTDDAELLIAGDLPGVGAQHHLRATTAMVNAVATTLGW